MFSLGLACNHSQLTLRTAHASINDNTVVVCTWKGEDGTLDHTYAM